MSDPASRERADRDPTLAAVEIFSDAHEKREDALAAAHETYVKELESAVAEALKTIHVPEKRDEFLKTLAEEAARTEDFDNALAIARAIEDENVRQAVQHAIWGSDLGKVIRDTIDSGSRASEFKTELNIRKADAGACTDPREMEVAYAAIAIAQFYSGLHRSKTAARETVDELMAKVPGSAVAHAHYLEFIRKSMGGDSDLFGWGLETLDSRVTDQTEKDALCAELAELVRAAEQAKALIERIADDEKHDAAAIAFIKKQGHSSRGEHNLGAVAGLAGMVRDIERRTALVQETFASRSGRVPRYEAESLLALGAHLTDIKARHAAYVAAASDPGKMFESRRDAFFDEDLEMLIGVAKVMRHEGDPVSADAIFENRTEALARSSVFAYDAQFKDKGSSYDAKIADFEKRRFLTTVRTWGSGIEDPKKRDAAYAGAIKKIAKTAFETEYRPQTVFYGEKKTASNEFILLMRSIQDEAELTKVAEQVADSLKAHLGAVQGSKGKAASSLEQRNESRNGVNALAKKMLHQLSLPTESIAAQKLNALTKARTPSERRITEQWAA